MQRQNAHLGSLYTAKRGRESTATQYELFPKPVNSTDQPITAQKSQSAPMPRQALGGSLVIGSKQSACMTLDTNSSVSP